MATTKKKPLSERWQAVVAESAERSSQNIDAQRIRVTTTMNVLEVASTFERTPAPEGLRELVRAGATIRDLVEELSRRKDDRFGTEMAAEEEARCEEWLSALAKMDADPSEGSTNPLDSLKRAMFGDEDDDGAAADDDAGPPPPAGKNAGEMKEAARPEETAPEEPTAGDDSAAEKPASLDDVVVSAAEDAPKACVSKTVEAEDESAVHEALRGDGGESPREEEEEEEEETEGSGPSKRWNPIASRAVVAARGARDAAREARRRSEEALMVCDAVVAAAMVTTNDDTATVTVRIRDRDDGQSDGSAFYRVGRNDPLHRILSDHARSKQKPLGALVFDFKNRRFAATATPAALGMKNLDEIGCTTAPRSLFGRIFARQRPSMTITTTTTTSGEPPSSATSSASSSSSPPEGLALDCNSIVTVRDEKNLALYSIRRSADLAVVFEAHARRSQVPLDHLTFTRHERPLEPSTTVAQLGTDASIDVRRLAPKKDAGGTSSATFQATTTTNSTTTTT